MAYGYSITIGCDKTYPALERRCGEYVGSETHSTLEAAKADANERARRFGWQLAPTTLCSEHKEQAARIAQEEWRKENEAAAAAGDESSWASVVLTGQDR